jgi:hypothetical protein
LIFDPAQHAVMFGSSRPNPRFAWFALSGRNVTASIRRAPRQIILDLDATDDPLHGEQEGRFFPKAEVRISFDFELRSVGQ